MSIPVEIYPALGLDGRCLGAFIGRVPGVDVNVEREEALQRLGGYHSGALVDLGLAHMPFVTAEQVHGAEVAEVNETTFIPVKGVDALMTNRPQICLGIYVADCCAVYVVDPEHEAIGLAHSGRKGTELGIVPALIRKMGERYGSRPEALVVQLSPCIRPPHYEVDFAARIVEQCRNLGVREILDDGENTGADLERYYSYRMEKGKTGRMLAVLALTKYD